MAAFAARAENTGLRITVRNEVLHPVDSRIFGQFMERASWGEPGYDAARDEENSNRLDPRVVDKMQWMNIPVIRWPAGADLPRIDWTDMIDNVPGREGGRPSFKGRKGNPDLTNEFGLDEFLALCEELECEPLLPVRFHPAVMRDSPDKFARQAAALVAYCNAEVGADLPEGMQNWPAIRKQNGREEPWGVKYFQIGNETWHYFNHALKKHEMEGAPIKEKAELYLRSLRTFLKAMHEIDPSIKIVVDGVTSGGRWVDQAVVTDPVVQEHASYFSVHLYQPWGTSQIQNADREKIPVDEVSAEDVWYNWVSVPEINPDTGQSNLPNWPDWWLVRDLNLPIACTEWNWNGWWSLGKGAGKPPLKSAWARGIGAAGMLHAFMRSGNDVRIACQSLLVGESWGITAIRVNDEDHPEPYFLPTGKVTGFYSRHHGNERLFCDIAGMPTYEQPLRINSIAPAPRVATVDVVATQNKDAVFLHLINRHIRDPIAATLDLAAVGYEGGPILHRYMTSEIRGDDAEISETTLAPKNNASEITITLPARSVSIVEIER